MNAEPRNVIDRDAELLASAESVVFKQLEQEVGLKAHVFFPDGERRGAKRPALLFFFGSGFDAGRVTQFAPQAMYFASRGAVSILIEYRTSQQHGASPIAAMQDARSAIRWVRFYAEPLGVDPSRVIAAGALAGGTLAAAAAMKSDLPDDETDPTDIDGRPDATVLFSPLLSIGKKGFASEAFERGGVALKEGAIIDLVAKGLPPMLILHGTGDRITPIDTVEKFAHRMRKKKNNCLLIPFEGRQHSFYNLNVDPITYDACNAEIDEFLVGTGFLDPAPEDSAGDVGEVHEM
ncbi:MAG: alpha/beta hydrolase [Verrucomicrobiae bacterium]|nr:alpha/beta hydrolase [Verrucomicrobiae bacterium]